MLTPNCDVVYKYFIDQKILIKMFIKNVYQKKKKTINKIVY